jgi:hypothetical protein
VPREHRHDDGEAHRVTEVPLPFSERQRRRLRTYLVLMAVCLTLVVVAWGWVRLWSTGLAVAMSVVAGLIPPVAAFLANRDSG